MASSDSVARGGAQPARPHYPAHAANLAELARRGRLRRLQTAAGLDFASNDYLGLAASGVLRDAAMAALAAGIPVGSGGSRLLRGNHSAHEALEQDAAQLFGAEAALYLGGGFQANQAIFATLPGKDDLVVYDALSHASVHEGLRLRRGPAVAFVHNDMADADQRIRAWRSAGGAGEVWLAVESVYSMEGDKAPMADVAALARRHDAILVVDEAHATGLYGPHGAGLAHGIEAAGVRLLTLHTCGKALGASGGLICGDRTLVDLLVTRARPFIFATAPSPLMAEVARAALGVLRDRPELRQRALELIAHAHAEAARCCGLSGLQTQIIPVIIGEDGRTMELAAALQAQGFDVRGIRPPTVPSGASRLRIAITGNVTCENVTNLFETLAGLQGAQA
ncbi:8-amino-7-oxononanoate synthase [Camelimonas sp. ID_303_24]